VDDIGKALQGLPVIGIVLTPIIVAAVAYSLYQRNRLLADLDKGDVHTLSGRIHLDISSSGRRNSAPDLTLTINWQHFKIDKRTLLAFHDREPYRIYYVPNMRQIVAAEPLDDTQQARDTYSDQAGDEWGKRKR